MKKIALYFSLLALNISAASEWNPTGATGWMTTNRHDARGVKFVLKTEHSLSQKQADCFTDAFSQSLALKLKSYMFFRDAEPILNQLIKEYEEKVLAVRERAFLEVIKKTDQDSFDAAYVHPCCAITKILLELTLKQSATQLKLAGEAVPGECCSFFPPYTMNEIKKPR